MRWSIVGSVFLVLTLSAPLALSQSFSPDESPVRRDFDLSFSSYCKGIPDDVKPHCAKVLYGNFKRAREKSAQVIPLAWLSLSVSGSDIDLSFSSYCKGKPEDVKFDCAKELSDNMKRALRKIAQVGPTEEITEAAKSLLALHGDDTLLELKAVQMPVLLVFNDVRVGDGVRDYSPMHREPNYWRMVSPDWRTGEPGPEGAVSSAEKLGQFGGEVVQMGFIVPAAAPYFAKLIRGFFVFVVLDIIKDEGKEIVKDTAKAIYRKVKEEGRKCLNDYLKCPAKSWGPCEIRMFQCLAKNVYDY